MNMDTRDAVAVELADVEKSYRVGKEAVAAIHPLNLHIQEGEFFSLLGPSGCGKSTTLRMIAGFEQPDSGAIRLHGKDVTTLGPSRRDVNMVFQGYGLFPHLDVWDNIAFGLRRKRLGKDEIRARVEDAIALVHLNDRVHRRPRELSGGQQQRVAVARALVNRPRALLLDEPLGALDLQLRQSMQAELKRIQREAGITFVYVTHDQNEALAMSDRIAVMNAGRVEQCDTPRRIYEAPASTFVAGFIGTSNLVTLPAREVLASGEAVLLASDGDRITVHVGSAIPGAAVTISVRPENAQLTSAPPQTGNRLFGRIVDTAYLGATVGYTVETAFHPKFSVSATTAGPSFSPGDEVWVGWKPEDTLAF